MGKFSSAVVVRRQSVGSFRLLVYLQSVSELCGTAGLWATLACGVAGLTASRGEGQSSNIQRAKMKPRDKNNENCPLQSVLFILRSVFCASPILGELHCRSLPCFSQISTNQ